MGSSMRPSTVCCRHTRATYPSSQSVMQAPLQTASAHQRPAVPGTRKRHNTTAGTARMRKYVNTLGRLTALTAAGAGATVFMGRTRALGVGGRQWGRDREDDHDLGNRSN